ncbi:MAG: DNA topoisomerase IV subunit A [Candidatus Marsarchaeota archaeon]|jgi:DNA topoisomerase-6 subunit A|nr:DNA topoisomerase IV subunit A [Candidatus Marsarchaeota archaeon]
MGAKPAGKRTDAEGSDEAGAERRLERLGRNIVDDIYNSKNPRFTTTTRSRSNTIYDKKGGFLRLGDATEDHTFINISQSKRFMQTMAIASKCHSFLEQNLHTSIRGLFYQLKYSLGDEVDENLFNEQTESNPLIEDLELTLGVRRESLNLNANRKGVLVGNMRVVDRFGEGAEMDMSKMGRSGWAIPSDVDNDIDFVDVKAKYVLVVEKDALWVRLNEDGFWKKENCILISTIGQAARGARRLIRKFADMGLPIYVFNDGDVWGWYIYWTIKTGSMNLAYIGKDIATPEARFLGVTISDLDRYEFLKSMTMKATEFDLKRAQEMLKYPWINQHKEWVDELKLVIKTKLKLEQDSLQGPRLTFVDDYIKEKINSKAYLP